MGNIRIPRSHVLALSATAAALSLGTGLAPANAADLKLTFDVAASVQIPAAPAAPGQFGENLHLRVGRIGTATAKDVKVVFDTTGLAGIATLTVPGCEAAGQTLTCNVGDLTYDSINLLQNPWLSAVAGVKPGTHGTLKVTETASNAQPATTDIRIDVGGPQFKVKALARQSVKPGATVSPVVEFANVGDSTASKVVLHIAAISGLGFKQHPSNCEFAGEPDGAAGSKSWPGSTDAVCTVDATVAPGAVLKLDPTDLLVGPSAYYTFADFDLFATEDAQYSDIPRLRRTHTFERGTGPALRAAATTDAGLLKAPRHSNDYMAEQEVTATNSADFSVIGAWVPKPGGDGRLTVGMRSAGPAAIFDRSGGEGTPVVEFDIPGGVTVTQVPEGCRSATWHDPKPVSYFCDEPFWVPAGFQQTYDFGIRLNPGTTKATARLSLQNTASRYGKGHPSAVMAWDPNSADDLASVTLGATPDGSVPTPGGGGSTPTARPTRIPPVAQPTGTAGASATATATATASASTAATSGATGLAFTGGGSGMGTTAAVGGGVIVLGGLLALWAARRRRGAHS